MTLTMYQNLSEVPAGRRCVALGTFDGVHLGHQAVIQSAVEMAERLGAVPCAATFHPRPATLLRPGTPADTLAGVTQRVRLLGEAGVEEVVIVRFTPAVAVLTAEEFVDQVLIEQLGAVKIGNDVEIGANTCIDRGALQDTIIEDGVKLDNLIQIGHNVHIGKHTAMAG